MDTRIEAYRSTPAARLRSQVADAFARFGDLTADEAAEMIGQSILAVRPRVTELKQAGLIHDSGKRRPNDSGKNAIVWSMRNYSL